MYLAEIHGKLSSRIERMEDILTSNVFSFFKYANREVFLKGYLNILDFDISDQEANEAKFIFWPRFEENTEPDLVIVVGNYYILIEAKYFSDFSEETQKTEAQLLREIKGGQLEANNYGKLFKLIAITADHYYKKDKFKVIPSNFSSSFQWTNWQSVSSFLCNILENNQEIENQEREFAFDLYGLLDKKNLRDFQSFDTLYNVKLHSKIYTFIFLKAKEVKFRGNFIGFTNSLVLDRKIISEKKEIVFFKQSGAKFREIFIGFKNSLISDKKVKKIKMNIFLHHEQKLFARLLQLKKILYTETPIFYNKE